MRGPLVATAIACVVLIVPPGALRAGLATAASTLFEAVPFLLAGAALARAFPRAFGAYLGCGCGPGPSARSLPAAAATCLVFGPAVALGRLAAAAGCAHLLERRLARCSHAGPHAPTLLAELSALVVPALTAGALLQLAGSFDLAAAPPLAGLAAGAVLGFAASPCGIGSVAIASALHARAPLAAGAFLCIAGIFDLRALSLRRAAARTEHDALAYALLAAGLAVVALRRGDTLVHPALALLLGVCALVVLVLALAHRTHAAARVRIAPALMLLGAFVTAPPPVYRADETTLSQLFDGERLTFTGALARDATHASLVRYAITCCRADAAPVAVRLSALPPFAPGTWLRADGTIEGVPGNPRLSATHLEPIAPPADPFVYR